MHYAFFFGKIQTIIVTHSVVVFLWLPTLTLWQPGALSFWLGLVNKSGIVSYGPFLLSMVVTTGELGPGVHYID